LTVGVAVAGIIWASRRATDALHKMGYLSEKLFLAVDEETEALQEAQQQFLSIDDYLSPALQELNAALLEAAVRNDPEAIRRFQRKSEEITAWVSLKKSTSLRMKLIVQDPLKFTVDVGELMKQIERTYAEGYLSSAERVTNATTAAASPEKLQAYDSAQRYSLHLQSLANRAAAQGGAIELFLSGSDLWRPRIKEFVRGLPEQQRSTVYLSLVTLVGLFVLLVVTSYRLVVAPLRTKLAESDAIIERQRKLAHFGELAAGLAHEIRNPLTAINARLFTLEQFVAEQSDGYEDALVIRAEINRLDRIVKDFLKLARPAEPQFATLTARPLLEEVAQLLSSQLQKQNIELKLDSAAEAPFRADPQQLKQVMINLVQNAADAIAKDGTITLSARFAVQRLQGRTQEVVVLEVTDTGPGITPEVQEHLFDPFYSTKRDGTGLGLPISARIADQHGGTLEFHSQLGGGTTFGIVLPVRGQTDET
jgi:signal transduction histidine kinase